MKHLELAIGELYHDERALARRLSGLAERHPGHRETFRLCRELAGWSARHAEELAAASLDHGFDAAAEPAPKLPYAVEFLDGERAAELPAELRLLRELRALYCQATSVSLDWEILAQTAQALRSERLLDLAARCHPDTLRQVRWANAALKENAPQIMITA